MHITQQQLRQKQRPQTATAIRSNSRPLSAGGSKLFNYQQQKVVPPGSIQEMRKSRAPSQLSQATPFSYNINHFDVRSASPEPQPSENNNQLNQHLQNMEITQADRQRRKVDKI